MSRQVLDKPFLCSAKLPLRSLISMNVPIVNHEAVLIMSVKPRGRSERLNHFTFLATPFEPILDLLVLEFADVSPWRELAREVPEGFENSQCFVF
jgi:hypothetical protein